MGLDPRTPVLVGVAAVQQREADPALAAEPLELMARALEAAAQDAGTQRLLADADSIRIPRGFWSYADPGRALLERFGNRAGKSELAELGILQTTLFGRAAADIAAGRSDIALITGADAKYRDQQARKRGAPAPISESVGSTPDSVLRPHAEILTALEIGHSLAMPVNQYAVIENALRAAQGLSLEAHRREIAELWSSFSRVAVDNPDAWRRDFVSPETLLDEEVNRMLAFPYGKLHNSQWNVDQAAGHILCSVEAARRAEIPEERWIHPWCVADANTMVPLSQRRDLHRSPGFAHAGAAVLEHSELEASDVTHLELYSCFPAAVRVQQLEIGIPRDRVPSVSGGMAFGGGPLNNFVLQAQARMAELLRADPQATGLVTATSGVLTKQGAMLWSAQPAPRRFRFADVSDATAADIAQVEVKADARGPARIAGYTVLCDPEGPVQLICLADLESGERTLAARADRGLAEEVVGFELTGREIELGPEGALTLL